MHRIHFQNKRGTVVYEAKIDKNYEPKTRYENATAPAFEVIYDVTVTNDDVEKQTRSILDMYQHQNLQLDQSEVRAMVDQRWKDNIHSVENKTLSIQSPILINAIYEVITYYPGDAARKKGGALVIRSPFRMLQLYRDELRSYHDASSQDPEKRTLCSQLQMLLETMRLDDNGSIDKAMKLYREKEKVTFDMLWVVLYPGRFVYTTIDGRSCGAVIRLLAWESPETEPDPTAVTVHMWRLCFDGMCLTKIGN